MTNTWHYPMTPNALAMIERKRVFIPAMTIGGSWHKPAVNTLTVDALTIRLGIKVDAEFEFAAWN